MEKITNASGITKEAPDGNIFKGDNHCNKKQLLIKKDDSCKSWEDTKDAMS